MRRIHRRIRLLLCAGFTATAFLASLPSMDCAKAHPEPEPLFGNKAEPADHTSAISLDGERTAEIDMTRLMVLMGGLLLLAVIFFAIWGWEAALVRRRRVKQRARDVRRDRHYIHLHGRLP